MTRATVPDSFSWTQFRVLFRVIGRGEERIDAAGVGMSLGARGHGKRRLGAGLRRVMTLAAFLLLASLFFSMGLAMGFMGATPYAAFSFALVCFVVMTVLIGLYQAVNVLYFVRDLGYYLTLPLSSVTVMWAKLAHFLLMSTTNDLFVLPVGLGCLWALGAEPAAYVIMSVAFVLCALAVNLALVIICVPLMRFSRVARDKDRFSRAFGVLITVFALAVGVSSQFVFRGDGMGSLAAGAGSLASEGPSAVVMGLLCPPALVARPVIEGGSLEVAGGLVAMAALVALYAALLSLLARRWYFEGVQALQGAGGKRSSRRFEVSDLRAAVRTRGAFAANLARDWKMMARTPAFFNQFVLSPVLMPVYFVVIIVVSVVFGFSQAGDAGMDSDALLTMVPALTSAVTPGSEVLTWCALGVFGLAVFMGFSSYALVMAVSRDGEDFFYLRAMPMDWSAYLAAKLVPTTLMGAVPILVLMVALMVALRVPLVSVAYLATLYVAAIGALDLFSLGLGARFPRLHWENEAQLTKGGSAALIVYAGLLVAVLVMAVPALVAALPMLTGGVVAVPAAQAAALALQIGECVLAAWWALVRCAGPLGRREP